MRQNQNPRRSRGRINNGRNPNGKPVQENNQQNRRSFSSSNRQYESQGPDGKNRGTASQLFERYSALSREVMASDRTLAEAFTQFADHYYRMAAEAAGHEAEAGRNREVAQSNADQRPEFTENQPPQGRSDSHVDNGNNGNVAIASETGFGSNAEEGPVRQSHAPRPSFEGNRDGNDPQRENSRRRRAQNYRDARVPAEEAVSRPAPSVPDVVQVAPVAAPVVQAAPAVADESAAVVVEVKPRRRIMRPAPQVDSGMVAEPAPQAQAEAGEPEVVEVAKPRRGRPRKVVLTDEPVL